MTREEFNKHSFRRDTIVEDRYGVVGRVTCVYFDEGIIHYKDLRRDKNFGRHISEITKIR